MRQRKSTSTTTTRSEGNVENENSLGNIANKVVDGGSTSETTKERKEDARLSLV